MTILSPTPGGNKRSNTLKNDLRFCPKFYSWNYLGICDMLLPCGMKGLWNFFVDRSSSRKLKFTFSQRYRVSYFRSNAQSCSSEKVFWLMQQVYSKTPMRRCNLKKVALQSTSRRTISEVLAQSTITCSKLTIETLENGVKYVQS